MLDICSQKKYFSAKTNSIFFLEKIQFTAQKNQFSAEKINLVSKKINILAKRKESSNSNKKINSELMKFISLPKKNKTSTEKKLKLVTPPKN